jgi:hypothetical protein
MKLKKEKRGDEKMKKSIYKNLIKIGLLSVILCFCVTSAAFAQYQLTMTVYGSGTTDPPDGYDEMRSSAFYINAYADTGHTFKGWSINGGALDATTPKFLIMDGPKNVVAHFTRSMTTFVSPDPSYGTVDQNPYKFAYEIDESVELTANPADGYEFVEWSGDLTGSVNPETVIMDDDKSIIATFAESTTTYTLTINPVPNPAEGSITKNPDLAEYDPDTVVTVTANPEPGYTFVQWDGDDIAGSTTNPETITMNADKTISATFGVGYSLNVTAVNGSVTKVPDKVTYDPDEVVQLTAMPDEGYDFVEWLGDLTGSTNPDNITMDSNKSVTAVFAIKTYTLNITAANGTVTIVPDSSPYDHGTLVTLKATPDTGYSFAGWEGDLIGYNSGHHSQLIIAMLEDKNITAVFTDAEQTLNILLLDDFSDSIGEENALRYSTGGSGGGEEKTTGPYSNRYKIDYAPVSWWYSCLWDGLHPDTKTDLTKYTHLALDVKGAVGGEDFYVGMEQTDKKEYDGVVGDLKISDYIASGAVTTDWQTVRIPLNRFITGVNLHSIQAINFVFDVPASPSGTVYFTNIRFEGAKIDDFEDSDNDDTLLMHGNSSTYSGGGVTSSVDTVDPDDPNNQCRQIDWNGVGWHGSLVGFELWNTIEPTDISHYTHLNMRVRGTDVPETFEIEFEEAVFGGANNKVALSSSSYITLLTAWQLMSIPLADFKTAGINDTMNMAALNLLFANGGHTASGTIYIDDIYLSYENLPPEIGDIIDVTLDGFNGSPPPPEAYDRLTFYFGHKNTFYIPAYDLDSEDVNHDGELDLTEDLNGNEIFDPGEDIDGDGNFDDVNEDANGNGCLDGLEDLDFDGYLDTGEDINHNGLMEKGDLIRYFEVQGYFPERASLDERSGLIRFHLTNSLDNHGHGDVQFYVNDGKSASAIKSIDIYVIDPTYFPQEYEVEESLGQIKVDRVSRKLLVDGKEFKIKSIGYNPTPIGKDPSDPADTDPFFLYDNDWHGTGDLLYTDGTVNRDFPLLDDLRANTIKAWSKVNDVLLAKANEYGIKVAATYWFPPHTSFADLGNQEELINDFKQFVTDYKDDPAILMWIIGNEVDLVNKDNPYNLKAWYRLANKMARARGETYAYTTYVDDYIKTYFEDFDNRSDKPLFVSEYGTETLYTWAFDGTGYPTGVSPSADLQTWWNLQNTGEILGIIELPGDTAGDILADQICVGGSLMAYSDEWWKDKIVDDKFDQDYGGYNSEGIGNNIHPDDYCNEEYWGLFEIDIDGTWPEAPWNMGDIYTADDLYKKEKDIDPGAGEVWVRPFDEIREDYFNVAPEIIQPLWHKTFYVGQNNAFLIIATDANGDALEFTASEQLGNATLTAVGDNAAKYEWNPIAGDIGEHQIVFRATEADIILDGWIDVGEQWPVGSKRDLTPVLTITVVDTGGDIIEPVANAGPDVEATEDALITFDGSLSGDNGGADSGGIVDYEWDFSYDGNPLNFIVDATGPIATHAFDEPGIHMVALRVRDYAGLESDLLPFTWPEEDPHLESDSIITVTIGDSMNRINVPYDISEEYGKVKAGIAEAVSRRGADGEDYDVFVHFDQENPSGYFEEVVTMADGISVIGEDTGRALIHGNILFSGIMNETSIENLTINYKTDKHVDSEELYHYWSRYGYYTIPVQILLDAGVTIIDSPNVRVKSCIIYPEPGVSYYGKGIQVYSLHGGPMLYPIIQNNLILYADAAVYLFTQPYRAASYPRGIEGLVVYNTLYENNHGIVARMHNENPLIANNIISDSVVDAIHLTYDDELAARTASIMYNDFWNNTNDVWCEATDAEQTPLGGWDIVDVIDLQNNCYLDPMYLDPPYDFTPDNEVDWIYFTDKGARLW